MNKAYKAAWASRWRKKHRKTVNDSKRVAYHKKKVRAIKFLGGKCRSCKLKYNGKNAAAFEFHHRKPKTKLFAVGNKVITYSWTRIKRELKKCDLTCANCHNIHHGGEW
jgi:hypothetical protein